MRNLTDKIEKYMNRDFISLFENTTVGEAHKIIREKSPKDSILYLYSVANDGKLIGVIPIRDFLIADDSELINNITKKDIIKVEDSFNVFQVCEYFHKYKFLALPVVNSEGKMIGTIDVNLFTEEYIDIADREQSEYAFELIGFRISQEKSFGTIQAWRLRLPWLLATIFSGIICAYLTGFYQNTLIENIFLAFFLTLVLALSESLSIQSMSIVIRELHFNIPDFIWILKKIGKEIMIALLLALSCSTIILILYFLIFGYNKTLPIITFSIFITGTFACLIGIIIPSILHSLKLDPKVASGPITLAITDITTIIVYLNFGSFIN